MKKNNKKGFTLVELVIVVAVMAVLVAVAIPTVSSITKTAKDTVSDSNARAIESVIKLAEAEASKTGDGTVQLSAQKIATAIYDAKMGITATATKSGDNVTYTPVKFYYDPNNGTVTKDAPAEGDLAKYVTISFTDASGKVHCSANPKVANDPAGYYGLKADGSATEWTAGALS